MPRPHAGFTLVELILTMMLVGVFAAVAGPRFFDRQAFDERMRYEEALGALRYAQKLALAGGCPVRARVGDGRVALDYPQGCGDEVEPGDPVLNPAVDGATELDAVEQSLVFNSLGCLVTPPNYRECVSGELTLAFAGGFSLVAHAATGFVEARP